MKINYASLILCILAGTVIGELVSSTIVALIICFLVGGALSFIAPILEVTK